jgi:glutathione S-transferase
MYKLYVIPGSHACRSAMLMLEHKGVPYRRVDFVTLTHPVMARLHGFDAGGETRVAGTRRTPGLRFGDALGTVPGLRADGRRISTNRAIARFLDERHPERPLLPADPEQRRAVEEAERWANEQLQMDARRIPLSWAMRDRPAVARETANGRMGPLLYRHALARRVIIPWLGQVFAADRDDDATLATLRGHLDRIDAFIAEGVLGGETPNVADFMVAPSLALILYRPDVRPLFEGRPALALVDRFLPEPA